MSRDFDKEILAAKAKVKKLKAEKEKAYNKRYIYIGKAVCEAFPDETVKIKTMADAKAFVKSLDITFIKKDDVRPLVSENISPHEETKNEDIF